MKKHKLVLLLIWITGVLAESGGFGGHSPGGRIKRFFDDASSETSSDSGCPTGNILLFGGTCEACKAGRYANKDANPQVCALCDYDTWSGDAADSCTACTGGTGTLEMGSTSAGSCIDVCTVPDIEFVSSKDPESRVVNEGTVAVTCQNGYTYGGNGAATIQCSKSTNNFPASCRKVSISATQTSIKEGDSGSIVCTVEASDNGNTIQWFKGDSTTALISDNSAYTIATTLASSTESDGKTMKSTSTLNILNFASDDAAPYSCKVDYNDPIQDDSSAKQDLAFLGLAITPNTAQIVSAASALELACAMNIDDTYFTRVVTWKLNSGSDIPSGVTTATTDSAFTSTLSLSSLALTDAGTYTCTATYSKSDNTGAISLTRSVEVTVRGFETNPADTDVSLGSELKISCIVSGDQQASISWTKDGSPVSGGVDAYVAPRTTSTLTMKTATADNAGEYKCSADFDGTTIDSNTATVNVYDIGITANPADAAFLVGEDAVLSCTLKNPGGSVGTPTLKWYKVVGDTSTEQSDSLVNFDGNNPGKSTLTFSAVALDKAGDYKCQVTYSGGSGPIIQESSTATLTVTITGEGTCNKPVITNGVVAPSSSRVAEGAKYTLTCNPGYKLDGAAEMTCTSGGVISPSSCSPGWTDIETRDEWIEFNVKNTPIEIWTDKPIQQSGALVQVNFQTAATGGEVAGGFAVDLENKKYKLINCYTDFKDIPQAEADRMLTEPVVNVWKFVLEKSEDAQGNADMSAKIYYNDIKVVEDDFSCDDDTWENAWYSRDQVAIQFPAADTASAGFRAETTEPSVVCTSKQAVFLRGQLTGCEEKWYLKTTDSDECNFEAGNKVIWTELHKCGTVASYDGTHVHYENAATCGNPADIDPADTNAIVRQIDKLTDFNFKCSYLRTGNVKDPQWSVPGVTQVELKDEGYLEFALEVYDKDFTKKEDKFPLDLELNSDLHMQLSVDSEDPKMTLAIVEVKATTQAVDSDDYDGSLHYLWKEGCKEDSTAEVIPISPSDSKKQRFKFKVFKFVAGKDGDSIYIHATVKVCGTDSADQCNFTCEKRRRRAAGTKSQTQNAAENLYKVSLGPFKTSDPAYKNLVHSGVCDRMGYDILLLTMTPLSTIFLN